MKRYIFGNICLIYVQKCKLRMVLKLCKQQLDVAGLERWTLLCL